MLLELTIRRLVLQLQLQILVVQEILQQSNTVLISRRASALVTTACTSMRRTPGQGRGRSDSKGHDRDRSASRKRAEMKKIPCKFFKGGQGNCTRGDRCAFSHEARSAAPATDKPSPKKASSRGRSPTPKAKGRKRSHGKKGEPSAAVCLRVKGSNACLAACRPKQDFWEVDSANDMIIRHHVMPRKALMQRSSCFAGMFAGSAHHQGRHQW